MVWLVLFFCNLWFLYVRNLANLKDVEDAIRSFNMEEKKQLISDLPKLLQLSSEDLDLLKLAEPAFQFWDNSDDSIYDSI